MVAGSQLSRPLEQVSGVKEETDPPGRTRTREVKHLLECFVDQSLNGFPAAMPGVGACLALAFPAAPPARWGSELAEPRQTGIFLFQTPHRQPLDFASRRKLLRGCGTGTQRPGGCQHPWSLPRAAAWRLIFSSLTRKLKGDFSLSVLSGSRHVTRSRFLVRPVSRWRANRRHCRGKG